MGRKGEAGRGRPMVCPYFVCGVCIPAVPRSAAPGIPRSLRSPPPYAGAKGAGDCCAVLPTSFLTAPRHSCVGRNPLPLSFSTKGARTE